MTDTQLRALCHRFFDALERADIDTVAALYAPGMQLWVNVTGRERFTLSGMLGIWLIYGVLRSGRL